MRKYPLDEALSIAEQHVERDRVEVVKQIGLRAAQIKYLVSRLSEWSRHSENKRIEDALSTFIPPMNDDLLLAFALNAPESFSQNVMGIVESELVRRPNESAQKWVVELEDALNGSRRTVLQNLSKHPAMKPFRLLRELVERRNDHVQVESESHARWKNVEHARNEKRKLEEEWAALTQEQGFETLARLLSSREEMLEKKKRLSMEWLRVWKTVEPVLQNLQEKSARFRQMENAQARTLQLYLANPLSARGKDPHGAGVLMLIRLSVESLEQEGSDLSDVERMESRDVLLECLQNSFFADYFGYSEELDHALEQNGRMLDEMPLNARRIMVERRGTAVTQEVETLLGEWDAWEQKKNGHKMELKRLEREADEACQHALGFGLLPLE